MPSPVEILDLFIYVLDLFVDGIMKVWHNCAIGDNEPCGYLYNHGQLAQTRVSAWEGAISLGGMFLVLFREKALRNFGYNIFFIV